MSERITMNPEICHGKPCIRGMRWPVEVIIDMLGSGMSVEDILEDYPELEKEDIHACINIPQNFLRDKAELDETLRLMDAGEMDSISLQEFEKETDEILKKYEI